MRRDFNRSVLNLNFEIGRLVGLAHPHVSDSEHSDLIVEYIIESLDNKEFAMPFFIADSFTVAKAVQAIGDYLTVRSPD